MPFSTKHVLPSSSEKQAPCSGLHDSNWNLFSKGGPLPASPWAHMAAVSSGADCFISLPLCTSWVKLMADCVGLPLMACRECMSLEAFQGFFSIAVLLWAPDCPQRPVPLITF